MSNKQEQTMEPRQQTPSPAVDKKVKRLNSNRKKAPLTDYQQGRENTSTKHHQSKQPLITTFLKHDNSNGRTKRPIEFLSQNYDLTALDQQLKKKDEAIQRLQEENKNEQQRTAKIRQQYYEFCQRTRQNILESKIELAEIIRKQKGTINTRFGYFRDFSCTSYIQGQYLIELKAKISKCELTINELDKKKSTTSSEEKFLILSQLQFMKKHLKQLKDELKIREKEVNGYKQQLKLYFKSLDCIFAKDNWPLLKNRYQPLYFIGSGGFGEVYAGFDIETYQEVAIKIHNLDNASAENYDLLAKHLNRQIKIHKQLKHPNIVRMIDQLDLENNRIGLVMEYCTGPELRSYLKKQGCLDERESKHIIKQVIYAVKYLHDQKYSVIHYDLKPANILLHQGMVKIVDFGISKIVEGDDSRIDLTSPKAGTYYYLPPEVFQEYDPKISSKVDVWSIGVIFYEMLYAKRPFGNGLSQQKILQSGEILKANHVDFPSCSPKNYRISEDAKHFIRKCLEYDPDKRMSSQEAYDDEYIS